MGSRDPRVDAYIEKSRDFAQPILRHLRELVHAACPACEETMRWSFPHFDHKGMMASMASFKQHCAFGFWKASLIDDPTGILAEGREQAMGHLGRITSLDDLPPDDVLAGFVRQAVDLNDRGVAVPKKPKPAPKELVVPAFFEAAVKASPQAWAAFESFSYSHRKEYVEWVTEAKTEPTRQKRLATTVEWLAEGKKRNWKYENC